MKPVAHLTCREVVELVTDFLEGRLPPEERTEFEMHLCLCDWCVTYLDQMREVVRNAGRVAEEDLPTDVRDGLLEAFRNWKGGGAR